MKVPIIDDVREAAKTIAPHAVRTPLLNSAILDDLVQAHVLLKPECLQRTGSFKFRGAYNALSHLSGKQLHHGVVACSSGNHAQGVAEAARLIGTKATIVMPSDAPETKKQRTMRSGGKIIEYDRQTGDREALTAEFAEKTGAAIIHPYDNVQVIAGQGTCGLEMADECEARGITPDRVFVCTGGGGLLAGIQLALLDRFPDVKVHIVEPQNYDDQVRSHARGERLAGNKGGPTVCDAIATPSPGELSFSMCKGRMAEGLTITDEEALRAVAFAYRELKLVVEPGGAAALAALMSGRVDCRGETVLITLSGGNMDGAILARALSLPE